MKKALMFLVSFGLLFCFFLTGMAKAEQFRITIMQDQSGAAQKYQALLDYLAGKGIQASFVEARDYPAAAYLFSTGEVDAMFSGSGIAGVFLLKDLAVPLVRPLDRDGHSTYWAAVIAPKGSPKFTGSAEYFNGKTVILCGLASSGEFYFRSLPGAPQTKTTMIKAFSHGFALDALEKGQADVAIVKNRVWDDSLGKYPSLVQVGEDKGENPDNTLIVSKTMPKKLASKVSSILLALKDDPSPEAQAAKNSLKIKGFIKTTTKDFDHTIDLLAKAGATRSFNFTY